MQVGEVRSIDMPSSEGYGKDGYPGWGIPPNARLVFEIEVRASRASVGPLKSAIGELCAFAKDRLFCCRSNWAFVPACDGTSAMEFDSGMSHAPAYCGAAFLKHCH
jgi:hypothetical protein